MAANTPVNPTTPSEINGEILILSEKVTRNGHNILPHVPAADIIDIAYDLTGVGNNSGI